jgi:hypothetical protein
MRRHLGEKPECQRLEASLLSITGEVERLPSVVGGLGRMPGQEVDLPDLTETAATHLTLHLLGGSDNFLEKPERLGVASGLRIGLAKEPHCGPAHAAIAVPRQTPWEDPRAKRAMTENSVIRPSFDSR